MVASSAEATTDAILLAHKPIRVVAADHQLQSLSLAALLAAAEQLCLIQCTLLLLTLDRRFKAVQVAAHLVQVAAQLAQVADRLSLKSLRLFLSQLFQLKLRTSSRRPSKRLILAMFLQLILTRSSPLVDDQTAKLVVT